MKMYNIHCVQCGLLIGQGTRPDPRKLICNTKECADAHYKDQPRPQAYIVFGEGLMPAVFLTLTDAIEYGYDGTGNYKVSPLYMGMNDSNSLQLRAREDGQTYD